MIAVFSDIHGNLPALEACWHHAMARGCTRFLNLGDIVSGPLWPRETADWLIDKDWPTISGNHEHDLLGGNPAEMGRSDSYALTQLDPRHLDWLRALPTDLQWREDIYLCHANPADDKHYLLHRVEPGLIRDAHEAELHEMVTGYGSHAIGCGHSHLPRHVVLNDGRQLFNPGSVGLPAYSWDVPHVHRMELGSTQARYAILAGEGEALSIELVGVDYDHEQAAAQAERNGRMDWAVPLRTGFVD